MSYTLTQDEALYLHNQAAHLGAFGEVDYNAQEEHSYWEAQVMSNPDGNTTGEHVPGTVDGTNVDVTSNRQEDQRQYNQSRSPFVRVPAAPTQVDPFALVTEPAVRERFAVTSDLGSVRPQGAVTVVRDGITYTVLPGGTHKGYDGTATTQRAIARESGAEAVRKGHRPMTNAERAAAHAQRERERKARENGEDIAVIERERAAYLAKRAKRCGEDSAAVIAAALAEGSSSWGGGNTATVAP